MDKIGVKAPAKINLFLDIVGKLPNGYHEIKSVMQTVDLFDYVKVEKADKITVDCNNNAPEGESNTDFIKRLCIGLNQIVIDMLERGVENAGVIMHGGAIMMLLAACAVPRKQTVEWTSDAGRGYSVMVTPSLYHSSGVIEVYDMI